MADKPKVESKKSKKMEPVELVDTKKKANHKQPTADSKKELATVSRKLSTTTDKTVAKAGKRSAKAIKEAEEKEAKQQRKAHIAEDKSETEKSEQIKKPIKPARSKLERSGKKYRKVSVLIDKGKNYTLKEALELAVKTSITKFDSSVEMHVNLGVDPTQADQNVRDIVVLPSGTGKTVKIAVFGDVDIVRTAKQAGADKAGNEDLLSEIDKGNISFDVLITTPQMMPKLAKYARVLGPKGLMPNPKSGTVTSDVTKAIQQAKAGRVEYRVDSTGIVHLAIGKVSFGSAKLEQNAKAVVASLKAAKPPSLKGNYVESFHITTTMGPSIKVKLTELS